MFFVKLGAVGLKLFFAFLLITCSCSVIEKLSLIDDLTISCSLTPINDVNKHDNIIFFTGYSLLSVLFDKYDKINL